MQRTATSLHASSSGSSAPPASGRVRTQRQRAFAAPPGVWGAASAAGARRAAQRWAAQRAPRRPRAQQGGSGGDDFESDETPFGRLFGESKLFSSPVVLEEVDDMLSKSDELKALEDKFVDLDVRGKHYCLDKKARWAEMVQVFMCRLKLAKDEDPAASILVTFMEQRLATGGMTLEKLHEGALNEVRLLRKLTGMEERAQGNPEMLAEIRSIVHEVLEPSNYMQDLRSDPDVTRAMEGPEAFVVFKDVINNPSTAHKYFDDPKHGKLARKLWEAVNKAQFGGGAA